MMRSNLKRLVKAWFLGSLVLIAGLSAGLLSNGALGHMTGTPVYVNASFERIVDRNNNLVVSPSDDASLRDQVYDLIRENPGIHFREICNQLDREVGVIQYHVRVLMHFHKISMMKDGRYNRYFHNSTRTFDAPGKAIVSAWQRPVEQQVLCLLKSDPKKKYTNKKLRELIGITRQGLTWHLDKLIEWGLVESSQVDGTFLYWLVDGVDEKIESLIQQGIISVA